MKRRKFIGWAGRSCVQQKIEVAWGSGTPMLSTWQCWLSKHGVWSTVLSLYSIECTKPYIFPAAHSWRPNWVTILSFVWRSLLAAWKVIIGGSRWRIGDGSLIGVTTNKWLSHDPFFISKPNPKLRVRDLIEDDTRQWDRGKIHILFMRRTRFEILALPLNNLQSWDSLIWMESKSKTFSVKTAYHVALRLKQQHLIEHLAARSDKLIWRKIWSLNVPPKVWNFVWRACSNSLPIRDNLHNRKVQVEVVCGQQPKTNGHILWECPLARNVWAMVEGKIQKFSNEARDFFLLFGFMVKNLD